jgi:hypothetical protein
MGQHLRLPHGPAIVPAGSYETRQQAAVYGDVTNEAQSDTALRDRRICAPSSKRRREECLGTFDSRGRTALEKRITSGDIMKAFLQFFTLPASSSSTEDRVRVAFNGVARTLATALPANPESTVAMRKLMEAQDCALRALAFKSEG